MGTPAYYCFGRNKDGMGSEIIKLMDINRQVKFIPISEAKQLMRNGQLEITNKKLTSDNRLIDVLNVNLVSYSPNGNKEDRCHRQHGIKAYTDV